MNTDLLYSEVEDDLRSSVRSLLSSRGDWPDVLRRIESETPYDEDGWRRLAVETGVAGLAVPEDRGGHGASWREVSVVAEELGRSVAVVPFLGGVLATAALLATDDSELLPAVAAGERTAVLAVPLSSYVSGPLPSVNVDGGRLTGTVTSVADARVADALLVLTTAGLCVVEDLSSGVQVTPRTSLDLTRPLADVHLQDVPGRRIAVGRRAVDDALAIGAAVLASEQLGVAEQCLATTVEHLKTRYQFGRPLGSFQGLKHRLAELWVEVTRARAVARYAAACVASGDPDTHVAVAVAASLCSDVAVLAAEECVQMHGGTGFTWEHPAHLWLKRAKADQIALGTPDRWRARLAGLLELPAT